MPWLHCLAQHDNKIFGELCQVRGISKVDVGYVEVQYHIGGDQGCRGTLSLSILYFLGLTLPATFQSHYLVTAHLLFAPFFFVIKTQTCGGHPLRFLKQDCMHGRRPFGFCEPSSFRSVKFACYVVSVLPQETNGRREMQCLCSTLPIGLSAFTISFPFSFFSELNSKFPLINKISLRKHLRDAQPGLKEGQREGTRIIGIV